MSPLAPNCECTVTPGFAFSNAAISAVNGVFSVPAPNTVSEPDAGELAGLPELAGVPVPAGVLALLVLLPELQPAASVMTTAAAAMPPSRKARLILPPDE